MVLNPTDNIVSRPDFTQRVTAVERSNNRQISRRSQLPTTETRLSFNRVYSERTSQIPHARGPLTVAEGPQPLWFVEGQQPMPYQPEKQLNIIPESVNTSVDTPAELLFKINGEVFAEIQIEPYGWKRAQIATLAELGEFADLDGTSALTYEVNNRGRQPLHGSISIRAVEVDLS